MLKGFFKRNEGSSLKWKLKELRWELKYAWQRVWRGYDDCDVFGFGDRIIKKITLILEDFIETSSGYPAEFSEDEWNNILKEMLEYFRNANEEYVDENYNFELSEQYDFMQENLKEGMKLFTKHCYSLWD